MADTPAARRWRAIVEEQRESGLTVRAFAESNSLNPKTLAWWRSRLRKLDREAAAAELVPTFTAVTGAPDLTAGTVVLALDDHRAHVVVDRDTDLELLRRLLEVVA